MAIRIRRIRPLSLHGCRAITTVDGRVAVGLGPLLVGPCVRLQNSSGAIAATANPMSGPNGTAHLITA